MKIYVRDVNELIFACDALILPLTEDNAPRSAGNSPVFNRIDKALNGLLKKIISAKEFSGKRNEIALIHTQGRIKPDRLLLIGLGKRKDITRDSLREAGGKAAARLRDLNLRDVALSCGLLRSLKMMPADLLEGSMLALYSFGKYKKDEDQKGLRTFTMLSAADMKGQIKQTERVISATCFARDLVNTPANDMTPSMLLKAARSLKNITVKVIDRKQAEKLGMGAFLSVARGSEEPPKFIVMSYKKKNMAPVVLIGKSITFDSGGISLKPALGMEKMKYDMSGGAAVLGVMKAVSEMKLPLHIIAILPAAENMSGGRASKPGDVVRSVEGRTIEIINTDAEGRLALADALGYAKRFKPSAVIDIATLTGACSVALGNEAIAMMGNDDSLMAKIKKASEETAEKVWQMPLFDEYKEYIKSDIADLKNSSGSSGSLVTAGYFLKEFADDMPWVHLDIAGTAWTDKDRPYIPRGATGIGVRLLLKFLELV
ncbi:MAG: leucyl aminopeptidase [Nitrospirota bacterium]|nr:leucyl aminopeptidase [Nitrospirota bacterium]